ncbi:roadblock/LC7 domain-containing protein [Streptomyces sp. NPDC001388]|uniref:roadblock/LC7 domain-containing protein n=1 Tax=unclassified Streptomyces TaxID=2593676 RepID=UPI00369E432B
MAAGPEILDELRRLRARVPQLTGALAAGVDGLVLAHDTPGVEPEGVAALTAAALGVAVRLADTTGQGDFRELLVRGVYGYVATYAAGGSAVLTVLAQDRVNVGRLHLESRRAGARIGELVDAYEAKEREVRAREPKAVPAKPPAQPPVRTPARPTAAPLWTRSARDTSTPARTTTESREEPRNTSWPTPKPH